MSELGNYPSPQSKPIQGLGAGSWELGARDRPLAHSANTALKTDPLSAHWAPEMLSQGMVGSRNLPRNCLSPATLQPIASFDNLTSCKECGFYERDTFSADDVIDEFTLCPDDFRLSHIGTFERHKEGQYNVSFLCLECSPHQGFYRGPGTPAHSLHSWTVSDERKEGRCDLNIISDGRGAKKKKKPKNPRKPRKKSRKKTHRKNQKKNQKPTQKTH